MKKLARIFSCVALAACAGLAFVGDAFANLPANIDEFNERYVEEGQTPEGAAQLWIEAIFVYQNPSTRSSGREMLRVIKYNLPADFEKKAFYGSMLDRIKNQQHIMRSYCAGSAPENNYKADINACELSIVKSKAGAEDNLWKIALKSSGADSERWMKLIKNENGLWQVSDASSMYMGIRPAKK